MRCTHRKETDTHKQKDKYYKRWLRGYGRRQGVGEDSGKLEHNRRDTRRVSCYRSGNMTICYTPMKEIRRENVGVKWCFKCRKHLPHDWIVLDTIEPSYYDPIARYDCPECHQEHVLFPGRVWEWQL